MQDTITKRIDSIARIPPECLTPTPPAPRSVKIELTGRCNYRCQYCALAARSEQPAHDIDWNLFARITKDMRHEGVSEIGLFFIGEPFMSPGLLIRAIHYLKDDLDFPYVFLTSNGSLAVPGTVRQCMEAGLDSLKWSVNAPVEFDDFERQMGVAKRNQEHAFLNIQLAWETRNMGGFSTRLYASSIRYDDAQPERMRPTLERYVFPYVDEHYWLPLYSMGDAATNRERAQGWKPTPGNRGRCDNPVDPLPCWSCFTEGHVLADGRMSACCFDATGKWIVGDLKTHSFLEVWHSPAFQELRRAHLARDVSATACAACAAL